MNDEEIIEEARDVPRRAAIDVQPNLLRRMANHAVNWSILDPTPWMHFFGRVTNRAIAIAVEVERRQWLC